MLESLASKPSAQVLLCRSEAERDRAQALFPHLCVVLANGDYSPLEGRKVVSLGIESAHMAIGYASECKVIEAEIPPDLAQAGAMAWAKAHAVPYNAAAQQNPATQVAVPEAPPEGNPAPTSQANPAEANEDQPISPGPSPAPAGPLQGDAEPPPSPDLDPPAAWLESHQDAPEPQSEGWRNPASLDWPTPTDFWGSTHLPPLSSDWLPYAVAPFALDQAALIGGDSAQMAVNIPVLCAAAITEEIGLQMQPGNDRWIERARLFGAVVGDPSTKKGPMMDAVVRHFLKKDIEIRKANEQALTDYDLEAKRHAFAEATWIKESAKAIGLAKPVPPEKPLSQRLWTDDATLQSLGKILSHHARGKITILKDELAAWFGSFDQFTNAKDGDRASYLSAYEGKSRYIDRSDGGRAFYVPSWSLNILGGIQPFTIARISGKLGEDGMLARFMIVVAQEATEGDERAPNRDALIAWVRVIDNLLAMRPGPEPVRFDPDAQEFRKDVGVWIHKAMRSGMPSAVVNALGKWEGLYGRLCLTYHCIESAAHSRPMPDPEISLDTCSRVWALMQNLLWPHLYNFYTSAMGGKENSDSIKLANFILSHLKDEGSEVSRAVLTTTELSSWAHWRTMRADDPSGRRIQFLFEAMTNAGWISPILKGAGKATRYRVNPDLSVRFAERMRIAVSERAKYAALLPDKMPSRRREPGED